MLSLLLIDITLIQKTRIERKIEKGIVYKNSWEITIEGYN